MYLLRTYAYLVALETTCTLALAAMLWFVYFR